MKNVMKRNRTACDPIAPHFEGDGCALPSRWRYDPIVADELPAHLKGRVKGLVHDLARDDLPMALLDMAGLYRALRKTEKRRPATETPAWPESRETLVLNDDQCTVEEVCMGPDDHGKCPWAESGKPVSCAGKWIMNRGWNFKVAPDAEGCPLVSLGLAQRYLRTTIAEEA